MSHLQLSPAVVAAVSQTFPSPSAPVASWLSPAWKKKNNKSKLNKELLNNTNLTVGK